MLDLMGSPDTKMKCVQIAGTNGKGSVATKIATGIQASDLSEDGKHFLRNHTITTPRVGLFTGPHIHSFRERIQVNGVPIREEEVAEIMPIIWEKADHEGELLTRFESLTLLAMEHFRRSGVNVAVLEAGLGGHIDSTNAVKSTCLSVVTSLALDHTHILGDTLEAIATEKAGIIKRGQAAAVIGPSIPPLDMVFRTRAQEVGGIPILIAGSESILSSSARGLEGDQAFSFEEENCQTSRTALAVLMDQGIVSEAGLAAGVAALPPCRFEVHEYLDDWKATVVLDVAHNPAALARLFALTTRRFPSVPLRVVLGLSGKKDASECLEVIRSCSAVECLHLVVQKNNPKAADAHSLSAASTDIGLRPAELVDDGAIEETVRLALEKAGRRGEVVVVCGSFMIMHDAKRTMGIQTVQQDPILLR